MARLNVDSGAGGAHVVEADVSKKPGQSLSIDIVDVDKKKATAPAASAKPASPTNRADRPQIEFLNGLRGLAAVFVVLHHAHMMEEFVNIGATAVDIFFVLSSFLLTMLFEKKVRSLVRMRAGPLQWLCALIDYFSKRFLRVYPLFAFVACLLWVLPNEDKARYYTLGAPQNYDLYKVLTFDPDARFFVFWTLPLEITYYFYIPLLVLTVVLLGRFWWIAVLPMYMWVVDEGLHIDRRPFVLLREHLSTFVAGSLAAIVYARLNELMVDKKDFVARNRSAVVAVVRVVQYSALALTLSLSFHGLFFNWIAPNPFEQHNGTSAFISVPVSVVLVLEVLFPSTLSQLLEWKLLCYAGKISFSMYLLHPFVIKHPWIEEKQATWFDQFFAWVALVFAVSTASYWAIEHPSQLLAQRVSSLLRSIERLGSGNPSSLPSMATGSSTSIPVTKGSRFCLRSQLEQFYKPMHKFV